MKVLVTGGTGFIGSNLSRSLVEDGHEVFIIDNCYTGKIDNISGILDDVVFTRIDLSNKEYISMVEDIISQVDVVYHLASSIGVKLILDNPKSTLHNSMNINNNLFPLFEKHQTKVIYASTSEVYGETKSECGSKETDKLEICPSHRTRGGYACSKLMSEFLINSYTFPSVIVRFFNIVGQTQVPNYGHVLPRFIDSAKKGEPLIINGDGEQVRSFCDIRDAVEMLKILIDDEHIGQTYNIGNDDNKCTINELAQTCISEFGSSSTTNHIPLSEAFGEKFDEIFIRFPNTDKIKKYYICKYTLGDIIKVIHENTGGSSSLG